jgi:hypothetical protein
VSERTCETCWWWKRISAGEDANDGDYPRGICTRNPPVIFQGASGLVSAFPDTDKDESCGRWKEREREPELQFEWTTDWGVARNDGPKINDPHPFHSPEFAAKVSESIADNLEAMWGVPQPVAYCIQCADDDPKVHSLSFDKAALGKVVTRHGGKVVPLYLGKP